jgi:hypothetical protein
VLRFLVHESNISLLGRFLFYLAGQDKGGYYHELFLRSKRFLSHRIQRIKIKGLGARKPSSPETEPNFYNAPHLPATRAPIENAPVSFVGNMPPSGPNMALGAGGSLSLQQIVAFRALAVSRTQQQQQFAPPHYLNHSAHLVDASQRQAHLQQFHVGPFHQEMGTIGSFDPHNFSMVSGHHDPTSAMAFALSRAKQYPATFVGLPGYWRGALG